MGLPLVRKELRWGRRNWLRLLVLLVGLPAVLVYLTLAFQHVLPTDVPVAIAPASPATTHDDLSITRATVTFFTDPSLYASKAAAMHALGREAVYAVVVVPPHLTDPNAGTANVDVFVSGSMVPYQKPTEAITGIVSAALNRVLERPVTASIRYAGPRHTLSEYLLPSFLLVLVYLVAFAYLPYNLAVEEPAVDRLRVQSSLHRVVLAKVGTFLVLVLLPVATFAATSRYLGSQVGFLTPGALAVVLLAFLASALFAAAVVVAFRFDPWGRLANLGVLFVVLGFSGLVYPVGFFSPGRRWIVRHVPLHYAAIALRGYTLRNDPFGAYPTWLAGLGGLVLVSGGLLWAAIAYYERTA